MTLDELRALADEFFEWPEGRRRRTVSTFSALLFAKHVLEMHQKSLGAGNSASTPGLRDAALVAAAEREACARRLEAIGCDHCAANIRARSKE